MTQTLILSNIIPKLNLNLEFLKKSLLNLNPLLTKHVYVYHLNFFMLHLVKHILIVIRVKNSLLGHLTNSILSLIYLYGSLFSSIECQTNKHFPIKSQNFFPCLPFYESATHFNYRISMDTKGPISPSSQNNSYIFVIIDAFSHFVVTNPAPHTTSKYAIQILLHHCITKFGPP